jgi:hypothetical protein
MSANSLRRQQALACLRRRMFALVGGLGLLLVVVTVWGLLAVDSANHRLEIALATANQLRETMDEVRQGQVDFKKQVQEWKDTLLRGANAADYAQYWSAFEAQDQAVTTTLQTARDSFAALELPTDELDQFLAEHAKLDGQYRQAIQSYRAGDPASVTAVDRQVRGMDRPPTDLLDAYVTRLAGIFKTRLADLNQASQARYRFDRKFREAMFLTVTAGLVAAIIFSVRALARVEEILEGEDGGAQK